MQLRMRHNSCVVANLKMTKTTSLSVRRYGRLELYNYYKNLKCKSRSKLVKSNHSRCYLMPLFARKIVPLLLLILISICWARKRK